MSFNESHTLPWVFFTFFKLYKRYHIAQNISYLSGAFCYEFEHVFAEKGYCEPISGQSFLIDLLYSLKISENGSLHLLGFQRVGRGNIAQLWFNIISTM